MAYVIEHKGKTIELPDFGTMPTGIIRQARKLDEQDQTWFMLEELLNEKQLAVLDALPVSEFAKHMKAWTEGISLGE